MTWHIVTGEYPPRCGGVGDYVALLAEALASAGEDVSVWTPGDVVAPSRAHVVHRLPDVFGPMSRAALAAAQRDAPGPLLLQYVPNALGARGANLAFCRWLRSYGRHADVRVMFHEPYFYFTLAQPWRNALAVAQRLMARWLLEASNIVYLSTDNWTPYLSAVGPLPPATVLPIPSTLPAASADPRFHTQMAPDGAPVLGHFGTYGPHVADLLGPALSTLGDTFPRLRFALAGAGSVAFAAKMARSHAHLAGRVWSSDRRDAREAAAVLASCDMLLQPYPDGVTTRRTSVMAGLRNAVATIATDGALTESVWRDTGAVALVPVGNGQALARVVSSWLAGADARAAQASRGRAVYDARFSMEHTVAALRATR